MITANHSSAIQQILTDLDLAREAESLSLVEVLSQFEKSEIIKLHDSLASLLSTEERRQKLFSLITSILIMRSVDAEKNRVASVLEKKLLAEKERFLTEIQARGQN